jgi:membrane protease YdiL (CAAX protease family)
MQDAQEMAGKTPPVSIAGRDLLLTFFLTLGVVAGFIAFSYWFGGRGRAMGLASGFVAYGGAFAAIWFGAVWRPGKRLSDIGLRRCDRSFVTLAIFAALLWIAVTSALYSAAGIWEQAIAAGKDMVEPFLQDHVQLILMLALAGPVAALVEEVAFRGLLYGWLRGHMGVAPAALLGSLLFTAAHFYVYVAGFVFFVEMLALSVLLALLFELSRSLWPGIVCHAINNLSVMALYILKG